MSGSPDVHWLVRVLAEQRREQGLSQRALAARMGTNQGAVSRLESGDAPASVWQVEAYADALGFGLVLAPALELKQASRDGFIVVKTLKR